jgi:hypothetical protein
MSDQDIYNLNEFNAKVIEFQCHKMANAIESAKPRTSNLQKLSEVKSIVP